MKDNNWISVEDRLPDNDEIVLCYGFSGENESIPEEMDYDLGQFTEGYGLNMFGLCNGYVTHWQPLPPCPID